MSGPTIQLLGVETPLLSITPIPLLGCIAAGLLFARAVGILGDRGRSVPVSQMVCFYGGLALILIGTQTFIDPVGEQSLQSLHMLQHLLIADLSAPLLLYGVRAPVLYFFWPRPVLVAAARQRWLRGLWAWLRRPPVALTIWLVTLYAWHLPLLYEAALTSRAVHDLAHLSFVLGGVLVWWPLLDPTHQRVEGRVWKAAYVVAARMIGGVLGVILIVAPRPLYETYGTASRVYGIDPLVDQQIAGGMMMLVDSVVIIFGVVLFLVTIDRGGEHRNDLDDPELQEAIRAGAAARAAP